MLMSECAPDKVDHKQIDRLKKSQIQPNVNYLNNQKSILKFSIGSLLV